MRRSTPAGGQPPHESGEVAAGDEAPGSDREIGGRHRRGMGISAKLILSISALMILLVIGIALFAAQRLKEAMLGEIKRNGANSTRMLIRLGREQAQKFEDRPKTEGWSGAGKLRDLLPRGDSDQIDLVDAVVINSAKQLIASARVPDVKRIEGGSPMGKIDDIQISSGTARFKRLETVATKKFADVFPHLVPGPASDELIGLLKDDKVQVKAPADVRVSEEGKSWRIKVELGPTYYLQKQGSQKQGYQLAVKRESARSQPVEVVQFKTTFRSAGGSKYAALLLLDRSKVNSRVKSVTLTLLVLGGLLGVMGVSVVYFISRGITRPIQSLVRDMNMVSHGDLSHVTRAHSTDEVGLLAMAFNDMTEALREAREHEREAERLEGELNTAREIQAGLLPKKIPRIPGFEIYPYYRSAKEVGGDYYDFFPINNECMAILVADVSGKGIPGSIVMTQARATIRLLAPEQPSAAVTLAKANQIIAREIKRGMFVTALSTILNVRTRELAVCSAGHNPMVLWRAKTGKYELINPNGIALGFDKGPIFQKTLQEQTIQLEQGDRVVLYTDGVVEAMSPQYEEYGDERFYQFVADHAKMRSKDFVMELVRSLDDHKGEAEQHDDITIVTFRVL